MPVPGADLDGIHYLRTLADSDALRARLDAGGRVVVVGAGWIGSEFAASARQRGLDVTVVDPPAAAERARSSAMRSAPSTATCTRGTASSCCWATGSSAFEGDGSVAARADRGGRVIECDFVVVGIGVVPRDRAGRARPG